MRIELALLLITIFMLAGARAEAAYRLFDFENDSEISAWVAGSSECKTSRNNELSSSGKSSLQFSSPEYKPGMQQWPAMQATPPLSDWRPYDRLIIDVTNPSLEYTPLLMYISDSKIPFRSGYMYQFDLPRQGFKRFVISLDNIPETVDRSDISVLHIFSITPKDLRVCLDNFTLLKPGESEPAVDPGMSERIARMKAAQVETTFQSFYTLKKDFNRFSRYPAIKKLADVQLGKWQSEVESLSEKLKTSTSPEQIDDVLRQYTSIYNSALHYKSELELTREYKALGMPDNGMLIGFASPMTKVLPRDNTFSLTTGKKISISAARNEKESFQVAVLPAKGDLRAVKVSVDSLQGPKGNVLDSKNIACEVVGYVQTKNPPPYEVSYIGWWPDPILNFMHSTDIKKGDLQTFWVRVSIPKNQSPGIYRGKLTVSAFSGEPAVFDLSVKVHSFTMPDCTPLPTAVTAIHPVNFSYIRDTICGGPEKWSKMKFVYADFLADYYIDFDNLYNLDPPDFEIIKHLHDQGRLVAFNLGYFTSDIAADIARFRPLYEKAKELGILDHAYIYGYDEASSDGFPQLEAATARLKQEFPGVPIMTTSYDTSYGLDSVVKSIDAWCPLTPTYGDQLEQAKKAREAGKMIWWYICCGPTNPYANWFVDYDAIEIRELMGVMTAKYKPDGFLYYSLAYWNDNKPITAGPFTDWNPVSYGAFHGDGSIYCAGPEGRPLATIRLENYRDGMEDYAYCKILEDIVSTYLSKSKLTSKQQTWLDKAQKALEVPESLVKSLTSYTRDPKQISTYREQIASLINSSGYPDADPWGKDFGVLGFKR